MKKLYMTAAAAVLMAASSLQASAVEGLTVLPMDGSTITNLTFISIEFDDYVKAWPSNEMMNPVSGPVKVISEITGQQIRYGGSLPQPGVGNENVVNIQFSADMCTEAYLKANGADDAPYGIVVPDGDYTVIIPAGGFTLTREDGTEVQSEEITLHYTLGEVSFSPVTITVNLPESPITRLETVTLDFNPAYTEIAINPDRKENIGLYDLGGVPLARDIFKVEFVDGKAVCTLSRPYYKEGRFQIEVPEGYFLIDGLPNHMTRSAAFNIVAGSEDDYKFEMTPDSGSTVEYISGITMKWIGSVSVQYGQSLCDYDETQAYFLRDGDPESEKIVAVLYPDFSTDDFTVIFRPELMIEEEGVWRLHIPAGAADGVTVNGKDIDNAPLFWTVKDASSVGTLGTENARFDIFNAQGIPVLRDATDSELHALPAGLYIAGGRKVVVR